MGNCFSILIYRKKTSKNFRRTASAQKWRTIFLAIRISCRLLQTVYNKELFRCTIVSVSRMNTPKGGYQHGQLRYIKQSRVG